MAGRIRSIKPELREHAPLAACSDGAVRLFFGAMTLVDDEGRCPAGAGYLAGAVFFGRQRAPKAVEGYVAELERAAMITTYVAADGAPYLEILDWHKKGSVTHQRIDKPQPGRYPAPVVADRSTNVLGIVVERSDTDLRPPTETTDQDLDRELPARAIPPSTEYDPQSQACVVALATATYGRVASARAEVCAELGRRELAMPDARVGTPSESGAFRQLLARVRGEGSDAPLVCETVVANLRRDASETGSLEWLSEKAFGEGAWTHARHSNSKRASPRQRGVYGSAQPSSNIPDDEHPTAFGAKQ